MNKSRYVVLLIILTLISLGALCYNIIIPDSTPIRNTTTDVAVQSNTLVTAFLKNEKKANKNYLNKILEVKGTIKEVNFMNNRQTVILRSDYKDHYILCDLEQGQLNQYPTLKKGQNIHIKGVCKGFLKDIILFNCIVLY